MSLFTTFIRNKLSYYSIEHLWKRIDELSSDHEILNRDTLNHEQVIELCSMLQETDELFRILQHIATLKKEVNDLKSDKPKNF